MATQAPSQVITLKPLAADAPRTPLQMALKRFSKNKLAMGGLVVVALFVLMAVFASVIAPFSLLDQDPVIQNSGLGAIDSVSGKTYVLGADSLGRDILTRLFYGSRVSLTVGLVAESLVLLIGVPVGLAAGYFGGSVDNLLMRFTDIMYAFPDLLFVIIIVTALGRSLFIIFISLGLVSWVGMARLVRGQVLQVKQMDYVLGARSIGARPVGLMARHIFPNILGPIIVLVTLGIPAAIIGEATLTYLGLGVEPSTPTWGTMVNDGFAAIFSHPTQVLFPALAIATLTLAMTFIGDGMRDAFDPRTKGVAVK